MESCMAVVKSEDALEELLALIEEPKRGLWWENNVKHIHKILKNGRELCMNAQIGDYSMDFFTLDLGSNVNILTK